jgi:paraquat-inducible protein A
MEARVKSLREEYPGRRDVPLLLAAAGVLLPLGLTLPTLTLSKIGGASESTFSVVTGIIDLARGGNVFLALLIFTFSLVFPMVKLTMLIAIWFRRIAPDRREEALHALKVLGKWSMLDVFVVASLVGSLQIGFLATATPRIGIYLFSGAALSSMVATVLESRLAHGREKTAERQGPRSLAALPIALLALVLLGAGLELPLMEVKKWIFWSRDYSVLAAVARMFREGHYGLAGIITLFVILAPLAKLLGQILLLFLRRTGEKQRRLSGMLEQLDKWMMIDVFALGLVVVVVKIGAIADVSPRSGLGCFLGGVFLSASLSWIHKS